MRINIYVDGFNFYYGAVKGTPYKWLDLRKLVGSSYPQDTIHKIRYFTARIKSRPDNPYAPQRQDVYIRAIKTLAELTVHEGNFRERIKPVYVLQSGLRKPHVDRALISEEKGSDVNLAAYLLMDGFKSDYDAAVIVSDDSDLIEPIRMVRRELHLKVGILNPQNHIDSRTGKLIPRYELQRAATSGFYKHVDRTLLGACQLPNPIIALDGTVLVKPSGW